MTSQSIDEVLLPQQDRISITFFDDQIVLAQTDGNGHIDQIFVAIENVGVFCATLLKLAGAE